VRRRGNRSIARGGKDGCKRECWNRAADRRDAKRKVGERRKGIRANRDRFDDLFDGIRNRCDHIGNHGDDVRNDGIRNIEKSRDWFDCDTGDGLQNRREPVRQ
jgi:hypothetical protein